MSSDCYSVARWNDKVWIKLVSKEISDEIFVTSAWSQSNSAYAVEGNGGIKSEWPRSAGKRDTNLGKYCSIQANAHELVIGRRRHVPPLAIFSLGMIKFRL